MLEHLTRAFFTFPVFPLVGLRDRTMRPTVVHDLVRIAKAALVDGRLTRQTVAVVGPEELPLAEAVRRVARASGRAPIFIRLPVFAHYAFAWCFEHVMTVPLVSIAQVRILSEGVSVSEPSAEALPADLTPTQPFSEAVIRRELPEPGPFQWRDLRAFSGRRP